MKKQITIILGIILALPLVLAMYGGESEVIEFSFETDNCEIVPNETEGINFSFYDNLVSVEPAINFIGSVNITCYDWQTKETETEESGGGGYYTYPWRNKVNVTDVNETEPIDYEEVLEETEEVIFDEEVIVDEPKSNWFWRITWSVIIIALIIILTISFTRNKSEEDIA